MTATAHGSGHPAPPSSNSENRGGDAVELAEFKVSVDRWRHAQRVLAGTGFTIGHTLHRYEEG